MARVHCTSKRILKNPFLYHSILCSLSRHFSPTPSHRIMVLFNAISALHLIEECTSEIEDRNNIDVDKEKASESHDQVSSPRDVASICDFVFGDDCALPQSEEIINCNKRSVSIESNESAKRRRLSSSMSMRNLNTLECSSTHLVRQDSNTSATNAADVDDWAYLNSIQPSQSDDGIATTVSRCSANSITSHHFNVDDNTHNSSNDKDEKAVESPGSSEGYGWFVRIDPDQDESNSEGYNKVDPYASMNKNDLAFTASVAPVRTRSAEEEELAWCTAADTVDDVLSDFF